MFPRTRARSSFRCFHDLFKINYRYQHSKHCLPKTTFYPAKTMPYKSTTVIHTFTEITSQHESNSSLGGTLTELVRN